MCLILFSWLESKEFPLIIAANRDERYQRPTSPLHQWEHPTGVIGGRDRIAGGSWLAVSQAGRFAAITNVRDPRPVGRDAPSRGELVTRFLQSDLSTDRWLQNLMHEATDYAGFNLLAGDLGKQQLFWYSNRRPKPLQLQPGLYGLSNGALDEPWPKVQRGKALFQDTTDKTLHRSELSAHGPSTDNPRDGLINGLFELLEDKHQPSDSELPDSGVGLELERLLAPITIRTEEYGTCSSQIVIAESSRTITVAEKNRRPGLSNNLPGSEDYDTRNPIYLQFTH